MRALALTILCFSCWAAPHPLTPLTAGEIRDAVRIFRASGHAPASARFHFIALDEPPKDAVLRHSPVSRRAFAVLYDRATNKTGEAVADLSAGKLASWKEIPGAQPPIGDDDSGLADRLVRSDPRWSAAMRARRLNANEAFTVAWPAGYFGLPGEDGPPLGPLPPIPRLAWAKLPRPPNGGVAAFVDLTNRRILEFIDIDRSAPV